jgi:hypothetical protein
VRRHAAATTSTFLVAAARWLLNDDVYYIYVKKDSDLRIAHHHIIIIIIIIKSIPGRVEEFLPRNLASHQRYYACVKDLPALIAITLPYHPACQFAPCSN